MAQQYAIGVDIGGTNIVAAVVAEDGRVLSRLSTPTEAERGPEDGIRRICELVERAESDAEIPPGDVAGIGIGCTGPLDLERGRVINPYTLPTWDDVPLVEAVSNRFGLPVVLLNDCDVAALGEHWVGAGKGTRNMLYITVGTGIGGGIIANGHLYRGVGLTAGEIGHHVIDINGPKCYCGARGCWEMLAAAPAIARAAAEAAQEGSLLLAMAGGNREKITAKLVADAAGRGDPVAGEIMRRTAFYLGTGVANLLNILAPDVVVMGGGVMQSWSLLAPGMMETIRARSGMVPFEHIRIVPAALKLNAGVIGAARALFDHLRGEL